jgi:hypothetical protein
MLALKNQYYQLLFRHQIMLYNSRNINCISSFLMINLLVILLHILLVSLYNVFGLDLNKITKLNVIHLFFNLSLV